MYSIRIIGMEKRWSVEDAMSGHNCDFETFKTIQASHVIFGKIESENKLVSISLSQNEHECSSGWTISQSAEMKCKFAHKISPLTHVPKEVLIIEIPKSFFTKQQGFYISENDPAADAVKNRYGIGDDDYHNLLSNRVFFFSDNGGDHWYPEGKYTVNEELFNTTARYKPNRVVWIWHGDSGTGKSFLGERIKDLTIYETDACAELPKVIYADIIIVGNKYEFDIAAIKSKIFEKAEIIECRFGS